MIDRYCVLGLEQEELRMWHTMVYAGGHCWAGSWQEQMTLNCLCHMLSVPRTNLVLQSEDRALVCSMEISHQVQLTVCCSRQTRLKRGIALHV